MQTSFRSRTITRAGGPEAIWPTKLLGIHHITAIAGDRSRTSIFTPGVLGLRLIKLTINFDDPGTYHLYYGDGIGHPARL